MHWQCFTFWISSRRFIKPREHKNTYPLAWSQDTIKNNWPKLDIVLKALIFIDPNTARGAPMSTSLYWDCVTLRYRAIAGAWDRTFYSKSDIIFILNDNEIKSSTSILIFFDKVYFLCQAMWVSFQREGAKWDKIWRARICPIFQKPWGGHRLYQCWNEYLSSDIPV